MKTLVVYYSRTGNTKIIAETIAKDLAADLEEITEIQPKTGIIGWLVAGKDATLQKSTPINALKHQVTNYDLVIIGTPVWSWNMSPPVRSFLQKYKQNLKQVAFFATMGGNGDQRAFTGMTKLTGLTPLATVALLERKIKRNDFKTSLLGFTEIINLFCNHKENNK